MSYAPTNEYNHQYGAPPAAGAHYVTPQTNSTPGTVYTAPQSHAGTETAYQHQVPKTATKSAVTSTPQEWDNSCTSCCTPFGTCCLATWCPCILFGRTRHRLTDPTLASHSGCNGSCMGFCALLPCGFSWVMGTMNRGNIRKQYHLKGSGCGDCLRSCCCPCCSLVQEEKEVVYRNQIGQDKGYQKIQGMKA